MQPERKQLEILLINYFRECHSDFPKGKIVSSESPDFILKMKTRNRIGIELTRLNPSNAVLPDADGLNQQKLQDQIISTAKSLFEQSSSLKLFVKFLFDDSIPVTDERLLSVTVRTTNAIRKAVQNKKPDDFFYTTLNSNELPKGLENILVINHPAMVMPVWERSNNLGVSGDVMADINKAILKKDEKLFLYHRQSLNLYWLLIITDRLRGTHSYNLNNQILNHVFKSHFQNVYLFDLIKSKVLQLV